MATYVWTLASLLATLVGTSWAAEYQHVATSLSQQSPHGMTRVAGEDAGAQTQPAEVRSLMGQRVLLATVEEVVSGQAKLDTGEVQPRFIPMKVRQDKGLPDLQKGDRVEITLNEQNQLVDVHLAGEVGHHRVIHGQLAQPLKTGHDKAVILSAGGKEEPHYIRSMARSKVASIPVGVDAVFLIDEADKIADVTFGDKEAVSRAAELWQKKTPLKREFRTNYRSDCKAFGARQNHHSYSRAKGTIIRSAPSRPAKPQKN